MELEWKDGKPPREWAKRHGWPAPRLGFERAFVARMLESDESFEQALAGSGVEITIPRKSYSFPESELASMDEAYRDHSWRWLVEALREIRRAVEAGVVVQVEGARLASFQSFYTWAHNRYHALEDGSDGWIGDDKPYY